MNICVIGTGYVGLVTGAVFADLGNEIICVDSNEEKVRNLNKGVMPIYEPGLEEMVRRNMSDKRLFFTTSIQNGVEKSELIFIAVGTPPKDNGETDLSQVKQVAGEIAEYINDYKIIINKSTVPVGTGNLVREIVGKNKQKQVDFDVVSNPEFLREGSAIKDTLHPDRIVIGAPSHKVAMKLLELYSTLERPMLITDVPSAEMIKYASNSFLATKISFINAIADICEKVDADVLQVAKGMGWDSRIGPDFLQAGLGYGGSCFPKDTESLFHTAAKYGIDFGLLREVITINEGRVDHFMGTIEGRMGDLSGKVLAMLGLAFKPDTDDLREAKSLELIERFLKKGAVVKTYDPVAMENCKRVYPNLIYCENPYEAAKDADALVIITEWREFKLLNLERIKAIMKQPLVFDGRNIYDPRVKKKLGFEYYGIGR
ncbi:MAG: UDP-glucose/GDP-mannose dehydrogenase family protein [Candidatus Schekmanbacteria bacterium]|nr:UDP-glucose/GDP-mannose dehydrogenase family protein [Candidatus Schekmanbacteria bacterium]